MSTYRLNEKALRGALCFALLCTVSACAPSLDADNPGAAAAADPNVYEIQSARIPRITTVSPTTASNIGGTLLTITGKSFEPGAQVFFGGIPATYVYVNSATQLSAQTGSGTLPVGAVAVKVVNPDGRQSERSDVLTLFNDNVALIAQRASTQLNGQLFATADFNGDGRQDLLIGDGYSRLSLLLNNGRGDYSDGAALPLPTGMGYFRTDVGDVNGDGKLDVILGNGYSSTISVVVYLGHGDGSFAAPVTSNLTTVLGFSNSYLGDVNGDGRVDLVISGNSAMPIYGVFTFFGGSDGHFSGAVSTSLTDLIGDGKFADVNGDGKLDLVANSPISSQVFFLAGRGDGSFGAMVASAVDANPTKLLLSDFNNDGKLDLATLGAGGKLSIRSGRGDGSFTGSTLVNSDPNTASLGTGDLTGDGKVNLVVGVSAHFDGTSDAPGAVFLLSGNGDATFATPRALSLTPLRSADTVRVLDADKDGKLDILVTSSYDVAFAVLYGRGGGNFVEDVQLPAGVNALAQADFNSDGKADLAAVSVGSNKLYVLFGNGDGTMAAARAYDTDRGPSELIIADVTGDGKADLLVSNYDAATVSLLPGNGDGTFNPQRIFSVGAGANALIAQDMNGDGKLDVVTANYEANTVSVLINNGAGGFNTAKAYSTGSGSGPAALFGGDFNGDGKLDVVTANADNNTVSYLQGSAASAGALNAAKSLTTGKAPNAISARDINGDGKLDIVTGNGDSGDISLLSGKGDGTFNAVSVLAQTGYVTDLATADLNSDTRANLIVSNGSLGHITLLYGFAGGVFSPSSRSVGASGVIATGDLNGDGRLDLLVAQNSGAVLLFLNVVK